MKDKQDLSVLQSCEVRSYYRSDFAYKSHFHQNSGGRIYSYQTMREAINFFSEREPKIYSNIRLLILGFDSAKNSRTGLCKSTITNHYQKFRCDILHWLEKQEYELIDSECPSAEKCIERKSRMDRFRNRELDKLGMQVTLIEGELRMTSGHFLRLVRQTSKADLVRWLTNAGIDVDQLPQKEVEAVWKNKPRTRTIYFLNREQCLILIGKVKYEGVKILLRADLEKLFQQDPVELDQLEIGQQRKVNAEPKEKRSAKLKRQQVAQIRADLRRGKKMSELAREYGVSGFTILQIREGRTWKGVV